jgi:rhodanese-related sulfurtransferase
MTAPIKRIDAAGLKGALHDGGEIALLDAREEVPFDARHLLMASCVPLSRLELLVDACVPRRAARVVWCDDGDGLAARAASRMAAFGYTDVAVLEGGIKAWEAAGFAIYSGVHVPSKAFAEVVEHEAATPWITAEELKRLIDSGEDVALFDSRSYEEYHENSIPTAVSVPGAELVYRFDDLVPSPATMVVVNCGGRTRSIIGAQSLINARVPNKVVSLRNGTQAWHLVGFPVLRGGDRAPACDVGARPCGGPGTGGSRGCAFRSGANRRGNAFPVDGGSRPDALRVRCAHARRICGRARSRHEERARRSAGAGNRPARGDVGRPGGAGRRRRRARGDDRALDEADGMGRRSHDRGHGRGGFRDGCVDPAGAGAAWPG